jgi:glucosyl-3-phosphoglycerate synthase
LTNIYDPAQFLPVESLAESKVRQHATISVVIPALNEEATIGPLVSMLHREMVRDCGLVDEIIVMNDASTDRTREVAEAAGARVVDTGSVLPQRAVPSGKGSALWKSQFVARGDVLVCLDADVKNFDTRFVYGLVGPLLTNPDVSFVKAFYTRPFVVANNTVLQHYGGRVTEILVRPFLAAFCPELATLCQPLSGEYSFRKSFMNQLPMFSGYSVEIGLLLEIHRRFGMSCLAQVDMGVRYHRNRPVEELGKMSFGILRTILAKLQQSSAVELRTAASTEMISWLGGDQWERTTIHEVELPPVGSLPAQGAGTQTEACTQ